MKVSHLSTLLCKLLLCDSTTCTIVRCELTFTLPTYEKSVQTFPKEEYPAVSSYMKTIPINRGSVRNMVFDISKAV